MRNLKKSILLILSVVMFGVIATACGGGSSSKINGVSLNADSGAGTAANPYAISMAVDTDKVLTMTITPSDASDKSFTWQAVKKNGDAFVLDTAAKITAQQTGTTLKLRATEAGEHYVRGTAKANSSVVTYIKATVTGTAVLATSINMPDAEDGDGSAAAPYTFNVAATQSNVITYAVRPNNATDKTVNWKVVKKVGDEYKDLEAGETAGVTLSSTSNKLTVTGVTAGELCYVLGTTVDNNAKVYLAVTVNSYTGVDSITSSTLKAAQVGAEYQYVLNTAVGTKWDMTDGEMARKAMLMAGNGGPGGMQAPRNLTYYPLLKGFGLSVLPAEASNKDVTITYSNDSIIKVNADGSYQVKAAGETIVTVTSVANADVKCKIKVISAESIYSGVLKSEYDKVTATTNYNWNFDADHGLQPQNDRYDQWHLVVGQSTRTRANIASSSDGNIKLFYMGASDRPYGVCLEGNVSDIGDTALASNLMWAKVSLSENVRTITLKIGNNDKMHVNFRVLFADEDGNVTVLSDGFEGFTRPIDERNVKYDLPQAIRGKTGALVVEQKLNDKNNNGELQIKDIQIQTYVAVTGVTLSPTTGTVGQGGEYNVGSCVTVAPSNATEGGVTYAVTDASGKVTIDASGKVTVAADAAVGDYTITVTSKDNSAMTATFTLTVEAYVPVTSITVGGFTDGGSYKYLFDTAADINYTSKPVAITVGFLPVDASVKTFSVVSSNTDAVIYANGALKFVGAGTSTITVTSLDNGEAKVVFTVVVDAFSASTSFIETTKITKADATNAAASDVKDWNSKALLEKEWNVKTVYKSHSNAKFSIESDARIMFEGHSNDANSQAVNIAWNKVNVTAEASTFTFRVRSHDDDRAMESASFKVSVITSLDSTPVVTVLKDWTTVSVKWKQFNEKIPVFIDLSAYAGQSVIVYIEQTAGFSNANFPNGFTASDSAAGAYLHMDALKLTGDEVKDTTDVRLALNQKTALAAGWTAQNDAYATGAKVYNEDGTVKEFSLNYTGAADGAMALSTDSIYKRGSNPTFAVWGLFDALDNTYSASAPQVSYELAAGETVVAYENNTLIAKTTGTAVLTVKFAKRGGGFVTATVNVNVTINA